MPQRLTFVHFFLVLTVFGVAALFLFNRLTEKGKESNALLTHGRNAAATNEVQIKSLNAILKDAKEFSLKRSPIFLAFINDAYLPLTYNFLCNTHNMSVHERLFVVSFNKKTYENLTRDWPEVQTRLLMLSQSLQGSQAFNHVGYVRLMAKRTEIMLCLLKEKVEFILIESDMLWLINPLSHMEQYADRDMVGTVHNLVNHTMAGAILYIKPTPNSITFWTLLQQHMQKLLKRVAKLPATAFMPGRYENDQVFLQQLIRSKCCKLKYSIMPFELAANGKWYDLPAAKRKKYKPLFIHNNYIVGEKVKIARAKKFGHWFLTSSGKCNVSAVDAFFQSLS